MHLFKLAYMATTPGMYQQAMMNIFSHVGNESRGPAIR